MPAIYAHDRFGQDVLTLVAGVVGDLLQTERSAFDLGLQGPDFLFYYKPYMPNQLRKMGGHAHELSGRRFFSRCAVIQRENPDDANMAYLLGCLCHYALDSHLHPIINARCAKGDVIHSEAEMAFDRALMVEDGLDPLTVPLGTNLDSDENEYLAEGVSMFYPPLEPEKVVKCVEGMVDFQKLLLMPNKAKRVALGSAMYLTGPARRDFMGHVMSEKPVEELNGLVDDLKKAYAELLPQIPDYMEELLMAVYHNKKFSERFDVNFEGK